MPSDATGVAALGSFVSASLPVVSVRCPEAIEAALAGVHVPASPGVDGEGATPDELRAVVEPLAASVTSALRDVAFVDLVPSIRLRSHEAIPIAGCSTRLSNCLRNQGVERWGDLLGSTIEDVFGWWSAGVGTVTELVAEVMMTGLEAAAAQATSEEDAQQYESIARFNAAAIEIASYGAGFSEHETWMSAIVRVASAREVPSRVQEALELLENLSCSELAGTGVARYDVHAVGHRLAATLKPRQLEVFRRRTLRVADRPTLEQVGVEDGVTRERIRQIEAKAISRVEQLLATAEFDVLRATAEELQRQVGVAQPLDALPAQLQAVLSDPGSEEWFVAAVLAWAAGPYRVRDGWLVRRDAPDLGRAVRGQLRSAGHHGLIERDEAETILQGLGFRGSAGLRWLQGDVRVRVLADWILLWEGSQADKAELILRLHGSPMGTEELYEAIGDGSIRTLSNAIGDDSRFRRRGKARWGLDEWGGDEYTNTIDLMLDEIGERGGAAKVSDLVESITSRFPDVRPDTIRTYASSVVFVRTEPGVIRPRRPTDPLVTAGRLELARDCFLVDGHWALRIRVNSEHLRGSGFLVPTAFAVRLGLRPSERIEFSGDLGPITLAWRTQVQCSSIRPMLDTLGAVEGDLLFLSFRPPANVEVRHVSASEVRAASPTDQLLMQIGVRPASPDPLVSIGRALGLASPEHVSIGEIEARLREKGDGELVSLLPASDGAADLLPLLGALEGQQLEKKESLSYNIRTEERDKGLEQGVVKSVAGFLNASGGVLLIGVSDAGQVTGLDRDLEVLKKDLDRYELHMRALLGAAVGDAVLATAVAIRFHAIDGQTICEVRVDPAPSPVYVGDKNGALSFFVRSGNQTKSLPIDEAVQYINHRFRGDHSADVVLQSQPIHEDG